LYHEEGRLTPSAAGLQHEYTLRDHLGNTRVSFADLNHNLLLDTSEILQQNHYYPFGMNQEGAWGVPPHANRYQYNGKELNTDFGLNLNDYGARWYDAALARWQAVDPLAEKAENISWSNYIYVWNTPLIAIDPDGRSGETIIVGKEDQQFVLDNLHERTGARYTFNENNELIRDNSVEQKSDAYSNKIDQAIGSNETMEIKKGQMMSKWGMKVDIDAFAGGGVTEPRAVGMWNENGEIDVKEITVITITGNDNTQNKDKDGQPLLYKASDILLHEMVGHGLPMMGYPNTGNAIKNENTVRKSLGLPERENEEYHYE
jgi:RHS repeat-associated protein